MDPSGSPNTFRQLNSHAIWIKLTCANTPSSARYLSAGMAQLKAAVNRWGTSKLDARFH
jgi:hypothetical protein